MPKKQKKLFPNLKKKLSSFLTDESGKVTKKDALGLAAGGLIVSGFLDASANHGHCNGHNSNLSGAVNHSHNNQCIPYYSGTVSGHGSQGHASGYYRSGGHTSGYDRGAVISQGHASGYAAGGHVSGTRTAHSSGIVNGHSSGYPNGGHVSGYNQGAAISQGHASGHAPGGHQSGYTRGGHMSQAAINQTLYTNHNNAVHANHNSSGSGDSGS